MEILVFKTNACPQTLYGINECLKSINDIDSWDFDLEDTDRILRVKTTGASAGRVESALQAAGYKCNELAD